MGPVERGIPSVLELLREDEAAPKDGNPLAIERIYQANTITREQYLAILDEWRNEWRRQQNAGAISDMEMQAQELEGRMAKASVPKSFLNVPIDATRGELLASGEWLYVFSANGEDATRHACMALKGWLNRERFGLAAFVRSAAVLNAFKDDTGEFRHLQTVGLLVLSGLGSEAPTDWVIGRLYDLLDTRALNGLPTVIASWYRPDELAQHFAGRGNDGAAGEIANILMRHSRLVEV